MNFMKRRIRTYVKDILDIVSIQSFTGDTEGIKKCQEYVAGLATSLGFEVTKHGEGQVLVIQPKVTCRVPELGIVCHLDTVPFDESEWKHNPLGEVSEGRIYGRGVLDDKASIIVALNVFKELESEIKPSWQLIVGSAEEASPWSDMKAFLNENPVLPKFMVTIDGDGIQNGCRGYSDVELKFHRHTGGDIFLEDLWVHNGVNNMVPNRAFAQIDGSSLEANGKACHSSIPEEGDNALIKLVKRVAECEDARKEYLEFFEFMEVFNEKNCAETLGLAQGSSITPTNCSLENGVIRLTLNCRFGIGTEKQMIEEMLTGIAEKYKCGFSYSEIILPSYVPEDSKEMQMMCDAYEQVMGKKVVPVIARGTGYNAALPNCAIFGPRFIPEDDEPDTCHAANENRSIEDLEKFQKMLEIFVSKMLSD